MKERIEACERVLASAGLGLLWSEQGPCEEFFELVHSVDECTPLGTRICLRLAWGIWSEELPVQAAALLR